MTVPLRPAVAAFDAVGGWQRSPRPFPTTNEGAKGMGDPLEITFIGTASFPVARPTAQTALTAVQFIIDDVQSSPLLRIRHQECHFRQGPRDPGL